MHKGPRKAVAVFAILCLNAQRGERVRGFTVRTDLGSRGKELPGNFPRGRMGREVDFSWETEV